MCSLRREAMLLSGLALAACSRPGLRDFERTLAANDSATVALGQWCERRGLAPSPAIRAIADRGAVSVASPAVRQSLEVGPGELVDYRHVRLACGDKVLSVAHNWYVPARLSTAMNQALKTTDTPFGKIVAPLGFRRERLSQKRGRMTECPSGTVLSHRALLRDRDGRAFSLVVECYTATNMTKP
jgi:hypothetical protein